MSLQNVERVWLAEKKAEEEQKRLAELQKQLQEERQIMELRQLQAAHGQVTKTIDNSLDWMYEGPMSSAQKQQQSSEEFLLGKIYNAGSDRLKTEINTGNVSYFRNCDVICVQSFLQQLLLCRYCTVDPSAPPKWLNKVASKNDSFTRTHEDPFIMIKQEENKVKNSFT